MPKLDVRLKAVARQIRSSVHADIGSDHGHLLVALIKSGRIDRGIAVENKTSPYENSCRALRGLSADVRFGDGLEMLREGEADSLSICGMGAKSIVRILESYPSRIPKQVVLQPNRDAERVREWALRNGFHFIDEQTPIGHWPYPIMSFGRVGHGRDPAYEGVDEELGVMFGPLIIKRRDPAFENRLREEAEYLSGLNGRGPGSQRRFHLIETLLGRETTGL